MKKINFTFISALLLALGFAAPASAQMTYNFGNSGNCNFPPATCTVTGSATVASNLTLSAWGASSGANFAAATITDQNSSGIGVDSDGSGSPNHAVDNNGKLEVVMLNFNSNKVVLTGLSTGWSQVDTDLSVMRWIGGSSGPNMSSTLDFRSMTAAQLAASGWAIMSSHDMDGTNNSHTWGTLSATTGVGVNTSNSSSWWMISSYFGGGSLGAADHMSDYFKLLSVSATCVSNTSGGACNSTPVPAPATLALVGVALAGVGVSRRRKAK